MKSDKLDIATELLIATLSHNSDIAATSALWAGNCTEKKQQQAFARELKNKWKDHFKNLNRILVAHGEQEMELPRGW